MAANAQGMMGSSRMFMDRSVTQIAGMSPQGLHELTVYPSELQEGTPQHVRDQRIDTQGSNIEKFIEVDSPGLVPLSTQVPPKSRPP